MKHTLEHGQTSTFCYLRNVKVRNRRLTSMVVALLGRSLRYDEFICPLETTSNAIAFASFHVKLHFFRMLPLQEFPVQLNVVFSICSVQTNWIFFGPGHWPDLNFVKYVLYFVEPGILEPKSQCALNSGFYK